MNRPSTSPLNSTTVLAETHALNDMRAALGRKTEAMKTMAASLVEYKQRDEEHSHQVGDLNKTIEKLKRRVR